MQLSPGDGAVLKDLLPIFLVLFLAVSAYSQNAVVIGDNAYLRGSPAEDGAVVDTLNPASAVSIIKQQGPWFLVQSSPFVGWIHGNSIKLISSPVVYSRPVSAVSTASTQLSPSDGPLRSGSAPTSAAKKTVIATPGESGKREYLRGPMGGCYYIRPNGKKSYVDHAFCKPRSADVEASR